MSILIKGMEMPKEDEEIIIRIDSFGTVMTEYALPIVGVKAVPVQPHGRLIDAAKLKETLDYYISEAGWSDEINKALSWVKDEFIDSEQTVIPESEEG